MVVAAPLSTKGVHRWGNKAVITAGLCLVAVSMLGVTTLDVDSTTLHVIAVGMFLGLGMANIMAPATESIMGSLPREKAGVGSAMNDTTRQVGGAVGVALLGSILASRYASSVTAALGDGVPGAVVDRAKDSVGGALGVAR